MTRGMRPEDIGALVDVSDPRLSPDGSQVAFVVGTLDVEANKSRSRVWLAATDGSRPARALTSGADCDLAPRWSPDGCSLAFLSHRGESGSTLQVLPVGGPGEVVPLAEWPEEIEDLAWSPDGRSLAMLARVPEPGREHGVVPRDQPARRIDRLFSRLDGVGWVAGRNRHLLIVPADGTAPPRPLTTGPHEHRGLSWSPDGRSVATAAGRHDTWDLDRAVDLFAVALGGSAGEVTEPRRLHLTRPGVTITNPSWASDGQRVACHVGDSASDPRHTQIAVLDLATERLAVLTAALDRQCAPHLSGARAPIWSGDELVFAVEDGGNVELWKVPADGRADPVRVVGGQRQVVGWDVAGSIVAFAATTPTALPELFVVGADGVERQLTDLGARFHVEAAASAPERFLAPSSGGARVEAWLIRPQPFDSGASYPVLLNIHGGPFAQYGNRFFDEFQCQAGAGFAVLYCNPRGSSGYSESWARATRGPKAGEDPGSGWGGVDMDDVLAVVDEALNRFPFLDAQRLGVLGGSYGGYLTSWLIGHTDRFKAACSERAVNDMLALDSASDIASAFAANTGISHLDDPEEYRRTSPLTYVKDMHTPLLIVHSEDDLRCPVAQAESLFTALRLLERDVTFVRFPGEGHELSRSGAPNHRIERMTLLLDWFSERLG